MPSLVTPAFSMPVFVPPSRRFGMVHASLSSQPSTASQFVSPQLMTATDIFLKQPHVTPDTTFSPLVLPPLAPLAFVPAASKKVVSPEPLSDEDKAQLRSFFLPPTPAIPMPPPVALAPSSSVQAVTNQVEGVAKNPSIVSTPPTASTPLGHVEKTLAIQPTPPALTNQWKNHNRSMLQNGEAIIYALNIRTFGSKDKNGDGKIDPEAGESGTFLSAIENLPELKAMGVNTLHVLPINTVGKTRRLGEAGSLYATADYTALNPQFIDPKSSLKPEEQARAFVNAAHQLGMHVMVDVPSCASYDLLKQHPELVAKDDKGKLLTPYNWIDIIMFQNGPKLLAYYDKFFKLMAQDVGVDGFRCDVARARPLWFWKAIIDKYRGEMPQLGFLAESYIQEDQSPINNIPLDNPYGLLNVGFDSIYGQFHNFPSWNADDYTKYLLEAKSRTLHNAGTGKTFLGSFYTHDDKSLMKKGGVPQILLSTGLMHTQPWTNPYYIDGMLSGDPEELDIFDYTKRPQGKHPELATFARDMAQLREKHKDLLCHGQFIPFVPTTKPWNATLNKDVIAFARHLNGQTLLVLANKNINAATEATIKIPGWQANHPLTSEAPHCWQSSSFEQHPNRLTMKLEPGAFFVFPIQTPHLGEDIPDPFGEMNQFPPEAMLSNQPWAKALQRSYA